MPSSGQHYIPHGDMDKTLTCPRPHASIATCLATEKGASHSAVLASVMPALRAVPPPGRLPPRRPSATGHLGLGLPVALAVWLAAIPLLGAGPTWAKACYARVARATQRGKAFEYTQLDGAHEQLLIGAVPRSAAHLRALHDEGVRAVVTLNQAWEPQVRQQLGSS